MTSFVKESALSQADKPANTRALPPVLGRLLSGTFWLAIRVPVQVVLSLWTLRLILEGPGKDQLGAYGFAWGFGFFQFLFEFGASSALQRRISDAWTRGDHDGVNRSIASGMTFYAAMAVLQAAALMGVAYLAAPHSEFTGDSYRLVIKLLWLQAVTAPCYGMSVVVSSVIQAARRYDFVPRLELLIAVLRFLVLIVGVKTGVDFFVIVAAQTFLQIGLGLGPSLWVMNRELGYRLHFAGAGWADYRALWHISFYMALIQISVVMADKIDTTILGFMLHEPGPRIAEYNLVSKPFLQLRQTGWMLAYMVMPAVASLAAARDERGLERVKYDGARLHIGVLLPVGLLAWIHAAPFLSICFGDGVGYDAGELAPLMRLFLIAALPIVLSVPVQMSIGLGKIKVIALAALIGSLVNLPVSCLLTARLGMPGVIWGTVLTTLFSNLIAPAIYVFRAIPIDPWVFLKRTCAAPAAGAAALIAASWGVALATPPSLILEHRTLVFFGQLAIGVAAYGAGYLLVPTGRGDLAELGARFRR